MGRIEEALKRLGTRKSREIVGPELRRGGPRHQDSTSLPPLDLFVSPWRFASGDGTADAPAEAPALKPDPVEAPVPPAAGRYDGLDARSCQGDPVSRHPADTWLPGVESADCPTKTDGVAFGAHPGSIRLSSVVGVDEAEANPAVLCQVASATLEQPGARQAHEVQLRLARRIAFGQGTLPVLAQEAFEELLAAAGVARGRLVVRAPGATQATTLAVVGSWLTTMPLFDLEPLRTEFGPDRIVTTVRLTGGGAAGAEFQAVGRIPFTREQAFLGEAGMASLGTWLSGAMAMTGGRLLDPVEEASPPPSPGDAISDEMERVRRLSLKGGVLVARFGNGGAPGKWAVASVIGAMRKELRSSDLLGQLPTGELTALLVRASADGVVSVACRVKERLSALAREHRLPPIELGHALYPNGGGESLRSLVEQACTSAPSASEPSLQ